MPTRSSRRPAFLLSLVMPAAALVAACGSRGALDFDTVTQQAGVDAAGGGNGATGNGSTGGTGVGGTGGTGGTGGPGSADGGSTRPDASVPTAPRDAGRDAEAGLINCGTCVATSCGTDLAACVADTACRTTLQCVATTCLGTGGGTPSPTCFLTCANGDTASLTKLIGIFTCITGKCGADCGNVLGGLGGLGGGFAPGEGAHVAQVVDEKVSRAHARELFSEYLPYLPAICAAGE